MLLPRDFLIDRWEGGNLSSAEDAGNSVLSQAGDRLRVGTMRRLTSDALARHRGVPAWTLMPQIMQSVTLDEAADISFPPGLRRGQSVGGAC